VRNCAPENPEVGDKIPDSFCAGPGM